MQENEEGNIDDFTPPVFVPTGIINRLYRFAENRCEINWTSRMESDLEQASLHVDQLCIFLDENIRLVNYDANNLRAIVGVSGIDSAVSAWITAETMRRAKIEERVNLTDLFILSFRGMNLDDERYGKSFYESLINHFPELPIHFHWTDLTNAIQGIDILTGGILQSTNRIPMWVAEPTTSLIDLITVNMGYKVWAAALDCGNKTEEALGEINIPSGCLVRPLANLWKTQVYDLAEVLGIPEHLRSTKPINSTYGVSKVDAYFKDIPENISPRDIYGLLDLALKMLYDEKKSVEDVCLLLEQSPEFISKIQTKINSQAHRIMIPAFYPQKPKF